MIKEHKEIIELFKKRDENIVIAVLIKGRKISPKQKGGIFCDSSSKPNIVGDIDFFFI